MTTDGGEQRFQIAAGSSLQMSEAAPVRPVMFPVGGRLVAAYVTEFYAGPADSADAAAFRYVVAADDGRVLERRDLTVSEKRKDPPPDAACRLPLSRVRRDGQSTAARRSAAVTSARIRPAFPTARCRRSCRRIW